MRFFAPAVALTGLISSSSAAHRLSGRRHSVEYNPLVTPGYTTADGVCGVQSPRGATCILYEHGNCCSSYGWCGFSEAHCGEGCQKGFGWCFGEAEQYSSYSDPRVLPESTQAPAYSHIGYTWPSHVKPSTNYHQPSSIESTPGYSEPTHEYNTPPHVHSTSTPIYDTPTPSHYTPVQSYHPPAPSYAAPHSSEEHKTVYATHTVTHTSKTTKIVTITSDEQYNAPPTSSWYPTPSSVGYEVPSPSYEQPHSYEQPSSYEQSPSYAQPTNYEQRPGYERPSSYEHPSSYHQPPSYEHPSSHEHSPSSNAPAHYGHPPTPAVATTVYQTITVTAPSPELPLASSSWVDAYNITSVHKVSTTPAAYSPPAYMAPA